jgi:hypothetical protein
MSTLLAASFGRQLADLADVIDRDWNQSSPEGMFALHVFGAAGETGPTPDWPALTTSEELQAGRAPALAVAGFHLTRLPVPPQETASRWQAGLSRLRERNAFPPDRQAFPFRPPELLGIVLGAKKVLQADSPEFAWLVGVLKRLEGVTPTGRWSEIMGRYAAAHLGCPWAGAWPVADKSMTLDELAALRWVASSTEHAGHRAFDPRQLDEAVLKQAAVARPEPADIARAAVLYHSIRRASHELLESSLASTWQTGRPTRDAVALVVALCRRFHQFARQIQVRHAGRSTMAFDDEYDVQDAMHAILRFHFTDVRSEEWTPSYGGRATRMDFLLRPEEVVIEVKMTRRGLSQREVISQLTEDKERYRSHPNCRALVCFVYDPTGVCDNPAALESDVSVRDGDFRVEVVVAP